MLLQQEVQKSIEAGHFRSKPARTPASRKQVNELMAMVLELQDRVKVLESQLVSKEPKTGRRNAKKKHADTDSE